jgi:hypothetical protein
MHDDGATSPLTAIAVQLFCINPAGVFFLAAFSKLLFLCSNLRDTRLLPGESTLIASCEARGGWQTMREEYCGGEGAEGAAHC